jgi:hypothetical protein
MMPKGKIIGSDFYYRTLLKDEKGNLWCDDWDPLTKRSHWRKIKEAK